MLNMHILMVRRLLAFISRLASKPFRFSFPIKSSRPLISSPQYPGPKSVLAMNDVTPYSQDAGTIQYFINYKRSLGNYFSDIDNNVFLDLNNQFGTSALGYNNRQYVRLFNKRSIDTYQMQNIMTSFYPNEELGKTIQSLMKEAAPKTLEKIIFTQGSGLEMAIKVALAKAGDNVPIFWLGDQNCKKTWETRTLEEDSIDHIWNRNKHITFLQFPQLKYPILENYKENMAAEQKALENNTMVMKEKQVGILVIEPMQPDSFSVASNNFYKSLLNLAKQYNHMIIINEINTGCGATGELWAHNYWNAEVNPDIVAFGKKSHASGIFLSEAMFPRSEYDFAESFQASPINIVMFYEVVNAIHKKQLLNLVKRIGAELEKELRKLESLSNKAIYNIKGKGTLIAFHYDSNQCKDLVKELRFKGVNVGRLGDNGVALRPALILGDKEIMQFIKVMNEVLLRKK